MKSLVQIKEELSNLNFDEIEEALEIYKADNRIGVKKLLDKYNSKLSQYKLELARINKLSEYENSQYESGKSCIAGIDEVGRGCLAGPVMTAAVILPKDCIIQYINDSKKLSPSKREAISAEIKNKALDIGIGMIDSVTIDKINILQATYKSMQESVKNLKLKPDIILVDALTIPKIEIEQLSIIKGDSKSISIAAASIIAKVTRDKLMYDCSKIYPEYGFDKNKGYGTDDHIKAIKKYGLCPIHRQTFLRNIL